MKTAKNDKMHEFCRLPNYRVPRVHRPLKSSPKQKKPSAIAHKNGQKWQNSRVLSTSKLLCTEGHGPLKSFPEPKTVRRNPWQRPEMIKFTRFDDFQITVYRGSWAVEIVPGAKNRVLYPMKKARNDKIHVFCRLLNYRVPGVTGCCPSKRP